MPNKFGVRQDTISDLVLNFPNYTKEVSVSLFDKLESRKPFMVQENFALCYPVWFVLNVRTTYTNEVVINDDTGHNYFVTTPKDLIAKTLWENCCIVAQNFIEKYRRPNALKDHQLYPNTNLLNQGAIIDPSTNELYVFVQLVLDDSIKSAFECTFNSQEEYLLNFDPTIQDIVNSKFKIIGGNNE